MTSDTMEAFYRGAAAFLDLDRTQVDQVLADGDLQLNEETMSACRQALINRYTERWSRDLEPAPRPPAAGQSRDACHACHACHEGLAVEGLAVDCGSGTLDWTTVEDPDELIGREVETHAHGLAGFIEYPVGEWRDPETHGRVWVKIDGSQFDAVYHCEQLIIYNRHRLWVLR